MNDENIEREVEATLASLDAVQPCRASVSFLDRVMTAIDREEAAASEEKSAGWWPDLALAMVFLIVLLDGAALSWHWKTNQSREISRQALVEITRNSLWEDPQVPFRDPR